LKMISLKERAKIVFSSDDAVAGSDEEKKDLKVIHFSQAKFIDGKKPTVFTVRLLNSRERMQMAEAASLSQTQALFTAAEMAVVKVEGPGVKAATPDDVVNVLLAMDPEVVYTVAGWVMEQSSLKPGPLVGRK